MKKLLLSLSFVALGTLCFSRPVLVQTAQTVAASFISNYNSAPGRLNLELATTYYNGQQPVFYIFNVNSTKGFVIVAADDAVSPVLGYSASKNFTASNMSAEVSFWLNGYKEQITAVVQSNKGATKAIANEWEALLAQNEGNTAAKPTAVPPMLTTTWNQLPHYNLLCPPGTPTGCVATAMAQIMNFWQHPATGTGTHSYSSSTLGGTLTADFGNTTYDWANMPAALTSASTATEKNAIATLMFHCGVAVEMDYTATASGAQVIDNGSGDPCAETALKNFFGYKNTIAGYKRSDFTDPQWISMLKFEIDNGRPLLYTGYGQVGHAFVFDGYDDNNFFHVNWGWGGLSDGYFKVDNLNPSALGTGGNGGNFNFSQQALVMIEPASSTLPPNPYEPDYKVTLALNSTISTSAAVIDYNTAYTISADIKNLGPDTFRDGLIGVLFFNTTTNNPLFIFQGGEVTVAPDAVYPCSYTTTGDTSLKPGNYFLAFVSIKDTSRIELVFAEDGVSVNEAALTIQEGLGVSGQTLSPELFRTYPVPAKDHITLDWKGFEGTLTSIQLYNIKGQNVYQSDGHPSGTLRIPVNHLAEGNYILRITTGKGTMSQKITVKR